MKKIAIIVCVCAVFVLGCTGCGKNKKIVEEHTQEVISVMKGGEMEEINYLIFQNQCFDLGDNISGKGEEEGEKQEGILGELFEEVTLKVKKIGEDTIKYEIEAPDLSGIYKEFNKDNNMSQEEFTDYLKQYIEEAERQKKIVEVPYSIVDEKIKVNYRNEDFINAITGGLLESYKKAYQDMLEEYTGMK